MKYLGPFRLWLCYSLVIWQWWPKGICTSLYLTQFPWCEYTGNSTRSEAQTCNEPLSLHQSLWDASWVSIISSVQLSILVALWIQREACCHLETPNLWSPPKSRGTDEGSVNSLLRAPYTPPVRWWSGRRGAGGTEAQSTFFHIRN